MGMTFVSGHESSIESKEDGTVKIGES